MFETLGIGETPSLLDRYLVVDLKFVKDYKFYDLKNTCQATFRGEVLELQIMQNVAVKVLARALSSISLLERKLVR